MSGKIARLAVANMKKMNTKPVQYKRNKGFMGNKPDKQEDDSPASRVLKYTMMLREQRRQLKGDDI